MLGYVSESGNELRFDLEQVWQVSVQFKVPFAHYTMSSSHNWQKHCQVECNIFKKKIPSHFCVPLIQQQEKTLTPQITTLIEKVLLVASL